MAGKSWKQYLFRNCWGCGKQIPGWLYNKPPISWCGQSCKDTVDRLTKECKDQRYAPTELRLFLLARDGYRCFYCKSPVSNTTANMEHVKPWPKGRTTPANLVVACRKCNKEKYTDDTLRLEVGAKGRRGLYVHGIADLETSRSQESIRKVVSGYAKKPNPIDK